MGPGHFCYLSNEEKMLLLAEQGEVEVQEEVHQKLPKTYLYGKENRYSK